MEDRDKLKMSDKVVDMVEKEIKQDITDKDRKINELTKEVKSLQAKLTEQYAHFHL